MPCFDIVKNLELDKSFRVASVMSGFDLKLEHANEHFTGEIELPEKWNIGLIVGNSGAGKSTIAREVFGEEAFCNFQYSAKSVIDDMPKSCDVEQISKMFYSVGFGSVPSWIKPYSVLSTGEKMRVDLARALLEKDFLVFDEFTSVVDRRTAQTACMAINKAIKRTDKKFVAVSCHKDVAEYLQPDWIFDTGQMKTFFQQALEENSGLTSEKSLWGLGESLGSIII